MARPKAGEQYRLTSDWPPVPDGEVRPELGLRAGAVGTVREVVRADTPGAHDSSEDAVVVEFGQPHIEYDDDGTPRLGEHQRAVAFGLDAFAEAAEKVSG